MIFASDNWAGAHPAIAENLARHAAGYMSAYGSGDLDKAVGRTFCDIFEREVAVFFVGTGTAANALSMTALARPGGVYFAHAQAHMIADEGGAVEYLSGGGRLAPVDGPLGRITPQALQAEIDRYPAAFVHSGQPAAVSITQASEIGTVYGADDIEAIAGIVRANGLSLHMDGARFANALVSLDLTPAEMTWKRGVDIVSFGGTKNGCWCAEAVVFMDAAKAGQFPFIRKRAAQFFSKSRFVAAQFEAYFRDGLWLETARHANAMAGRLAAHVEASPHACLGWKPQANEVFPILEKTAAERLKAQGAVFYDWHPPREIAGGINENETLVRLVTSFATTQDEVDRFGALLA
ncbi:MAG: low specificity L-threonine aldolase [Aquamicrobium sp.]|uniref:threonine aldolase family protein n=1 Tax=Aquamicrobium sp. TaxID=1872579 RepID=UPI00349E8198|nr:low specificity L-threonine aldolase [Aquamicrobium sp.]